MSKKLVDFINEHKQFYSKYIKYPKFVHNEEFNISDDLFNFEISLLGIALSIHLKIQLLINQQSKFDINESILSLSNFNFLYEAYLDDQYTFDKLKDVYMSIFDDIYQGNEIKSTDILTIALFEMEAKTGIKANIDYGFTPNLTKYFDIFSKNIDISYLTNNEITDIEPNMIFNKDTYFVDNNFLINKDHLIDISIENNINLSQHIKKLIYKAILFKKYNEFNIKSITYINLRFKIYKTFNVSDVLKYDIVSNTLDKVVFICPNINFDDEELENIINEYNNILNSYLVNKSFFITTNERFKQFCKNHFFNANLSDKTYPYIFDSTLKTCDNANSYIFLSHKCYFDINSLNINQSKLKLIYV